MTAFPFDRLRQSRGEASCCGFPWAQSVAFDHFKANWHHRLRVLNECQRLTIPWKYKSSTRPEPSFASSFAGRFFGLCKVPAPNPEMDNVIFEDPSKQRLRLERPLQVLPVEVMPNQHDATYGEQQNCAPSQSLRPYDLDFTSCGRPSVSLISTVIFT